MHASPSPILADHLTRGAEFITLFGWELPAHFGDLVAEDRAARESVAVVDLSLLTVVRAQGADRADYLNRRLSQLILDLSEGDGRRATLLDAVGRMQADLEVHAVGDEFVLLAPPFEGERLAPLLEQYVFSEDCRFHDETRGFAKFALLGPRFADLLAALNVEPLDAGTRGAERTIAGQFGLRLINTDYVPEGVLLIAPAATARNVWDELVRAAQPLGGRAAGWEAFNARRIENAVPWFGLDLDHDTIPLEADLTQAIHFNKGCYPGQETIARISNLGHPARKLVAMRIDGGPAAPAARELTTPEGEPAGHITSSAWSHAHGNVAALAMVKWPHRVGGAELRTADGRRAVVRDSAEE